MVHCRFTEGRERFCGLARRGTTRERLAVSKREQLFTKAADRELYGLGAEHVNEARSLATSAAFFITCMISVLTQAGQATMNDKLRGNRMTVARPGDGLPSLIVRLRNERIASFRTHTIINDYELMG